MRHIPDFRPLYVEADGTLWGSRGFRLYYSVDRGRSLNFVGSCRATGLQAFGRFSRLVERATRSGFHSLLPLAGGAYLGIIRGWIVKLDSESLEFRKVFRIPRGSRPLNICIVPDGRIFWGEYFYNSERTSVEIYGSEDGGETWRSVYTFPDGAIRHIHSIIYDSFRDGCWVLTGDLDHESKIMFSRKLFDDLEPVFEGSQQERLASLIPRKDDLICGTDTEFEVNHIQRLDPISGSIEKVQKVEGSVFYAGVAGEYMVLSTVVEPSVVNPTSNASLWISRDGTKWGRLCQSRRDSWVLPRWAGMPSRITGSKLFQHGALIVPPGNNEKSEVFAYGQAIAGHDGDCLSWSAEELERASLG